MLITQQLNTVAQQNLNRPAVRYLGKEITYNELRTSIARLSYLYQHEIGAGARIAFFTRNSPSVITSFFAFSNIRCTVIPVNPELPPEDIIPWMKDIKPTHVAVTADLVNQAREIMQAGAMSFPLIEIEKKHGGEYDSSFTPSPDNQPLEIDVILQLRTGGRVDKPKVASFTHKQLQYASTGLKSAYRTTSADRFLTTLNWAHPFAFTHGMLYPLMTGGTCVIDHGLKALEFLDFMVESRVSRLIGTPPFYLKLLMTCRNEKRFLPGIRSVTVGIGSLSSDLRKAFGMLKIPVCQAYGQTENVWTIALEDLSAPDHENYKGGKGLPGIKYKVLDPNGDEVEGKGPRTGQLALMGPTVMNGYVEKDKETKNAIRGTWLYTGDIARLESDGEELKITFLGRKEDVISINGELTLPTKIDKVVKNLGGIKDAAAFVTKDQKGNSVIGLVVVKGPGSSLTEKQVMEYCTGHLSGSLQPKGATFTDFIPRDAGGGVNYHRLRAQFSHIVG